jgi:hypothetical protein
MDLSAIDHASGNVVAVGMEDGAVHVLQLHSIPSHATSRPSTARLMLTFSTRAPSG